MFHHPNRLPAPAMMVVLAVMVACSGCRKEDTGAIEPEPEVILARVGDEIITPADLLAEAARRLARRQPVPGKEVLLEQMVEHLALLHRAKAAKLDQDPEVRRAVERLLIGKLKERTLETELSGAEVDETTLRRAYEERIEEFTTPAKTRLAILKLASNPKESEGKRAEVKARLEEARVLAVADPPQGGRGPAAGGFGALAVRYSDDQVGRYRGGDAGWISSIENDPRWPREVLVAGAALGKDEISEVIEAAGGFYLVKKTDSRPAVTTSFEKALPLLRQRAVADQRARLAETYRDDTISQAGTKIYPEALTGIELPAAASPSGGNPEGERPPALPGVER